jgi:hypothetical protein
MNYPNVARAWRYAASAAVVAGLSACGGSFSGPYADDSGLMKFTFKSGHKVEMVAPFGGGSVEYDYEIKDKTLRILMPQGTQIFPIDDKGCFAVTFVGKVCKVKS